LTLDKNMPWYAVSLNARTQNMANILLCEPTIIMIHYHDWAKYLIVSLEMVLLLLWCHVAYFCNSLHVNNLNMKISMAAVLRSVPQPNNGAAFYENTAKWLSHVLNQLVQLNLASPQLIKRGSHVTAEQDYKWCESQAYIEIMSQWICA